MTFSLLGYLPFEGLEHIVFLETASLGKAEDLKCHYIGKNSISNTFKINRYYFLCVKSL